MNASTAAKVYRPSLYTPDLGCVAPSEVYVLIDGRAVAVYDGEIDALYDSLEALATEHARDSARMSVAEFCTTVLRGEARIVNFDADALANFVKAHAQAYGEKTVPASWRANTSHCDGDCIETARKQLDATAYAGETRFAWVDEDGDVVIATDDDLAAYGALLLADPETAWERWAGTSLGTEGTVTAEQIARNIVAGGKDWDTVDLGALRSEAAAHGDIATVAAIDHLADAIMDALARVAA